MMYKKFLLLILTCALVNATHSNDLESGKKKIVAIMSNEETGIAAYNKKNIQTADSLNLEQDLNTQAIAEFFGCKTLIGQSFFHETLKSPLSPAAHNIIAERQRAIKMLVDHPELKQEIEQLLEQARQEEQDVITLMSDFFVGKSCPELKGLEQLKEQNSKLFPLLNYLYMNPTGKTISFGMNIFSAIATPVWTAISAYYTNMLRKNELPYAKPALWTTYSALASSMMFYTVYKDYMNAFEKRSKMHALNQLIMVAEKFDAIAQKCTVKTQFTMHHIKNPVGLDLVARLKQQRYQAKRSFFFHVPAVHSFLYKLYEKQKHLAEVFACIAEMDAYNAIATKIIEHQHTSNKFCFVQFINDTKPHIKTKAFWNVLVPNPITNTLEEHRNVMLTGPNAGGKTTTIRALLQNIVLGQTFGIAAAESCEYTMFDVIHSYLTISDDLVRGLSLFASEVKRAQAIVQKMKSLEVGKKFFFALDELFTGTVAEDGEHCAYEFVKNIATFTNSLFIYATHFDKLKELGNTGTYCTNYKVDAPTKNSLGKLVYPYTLSRGANTSRVAIDIAKEANLFA